MEEELEQLVRAVLAELGFSDKAVEVIAALDKQWMRKIEALKRLTAAAGDEIARLLDEKHQIPTHITQATRKGPRGRGGAGPRGAPAPPPEPQKLALGVREPPPGASDVIKWSPPPRSKAQPPLGEGGCCSLSRPSDDLKIS